MMYIHDHICISAQDTFENSDLTLSIESANNKLTAREPGYQGIPPGILRRMGKAVRMGVGAALPIVSGQPQIDGIIVGTANGGMEDCIKFLNQIIDYEEGMLTPGNFVQSTPNAIAAQVGLMTKNKSYNITHVHRGLAFENALLDAQMQLNEYPDHQYLTGAVDEISAYNYNIDLLDGWYKREPITATELYASQTTGSIAGEGAAMFLFNNIRKNASGVIKAVHSIHTADKDLVGSHLRAFITRYATQEEINTLITGENGDCRTLLYYQLAESLLGEDVTNIRYKHLCGEFPTSSAIAVWLGCTITQWPSHMLKSTGKTDNHGNILIYNNYKGLQHSFILMEKL